MNKSAKYCYTQQQRTDLLIDYVHHGQIISKEFHLVETHLEDCIHCQETVLEIKQFLNATDLEEKKLPQKMSEKYHFNLWFASLKAHLMGNISHFPQLLGHQFRLLFKHPKAKSNLMTAASLVVVLFVSLNIYFSNRVDPLTQFSALETNQNQTTNYAIQLGGDLVEIEPTY